MPTIRFPNLMNEATGLPHRPPPGADVFPDGETTRKLVTCPHCKLKGVVYYWAPYEMAYKTDCIKCGMAAVVKPSDATFQEIQQQGARRQDGKRRDEETGVIDATKRIEDRRTRRELGKRYYRV